MQYKIGQIVTSRKGRDTNRSYVVVGFEADRLLLVNGCKFTAEKPKKKNDRHLTATKSELQGKDFSNGKITETLTAFNMRKEMDMSGG